MYDGWVKLHRKLLDSSVWGNSHLLQVWIWCIMRANYTETQITFAGEEITLAPGSFVTGRSTGAAQCHMKESTFRNQLQSLERAGMIAQKTDNKRTVVTVCKYSDYQISENESGQQKDNKRTQIRSNKEEVRNENTSSAKTEPETMDELAPYLDAWNRICGHIQKATKLSTQRKKHLRARINEPIFRDNYESILAKIAASDFCSGKNDRSWKADFDWLIANDSNYVKVYEGKYDNKGNNKPEPIKYPWKG